MPKTRHLDKELVQRRVKLDNRIKRMKDEIAKLSFYLADSNHPSVKAASRTLMMVEDERDQLQRRIEGHMV